MEFAISAIFLLIILLPGFIAKNTFTRGIWSEKSPRFSQAVVEQIPTAILISGTIHAVWLTICLKLHSVISAVLPVNFRFASMLLLGTYGDKSKSFDSVINNISSHSTQIFFYFFSIYIAAFLCGLLLHFYIRGKRLDLRYSFCRFDNPWFYLLSGEAIMFGEDVLGGTVLGNVDLERDPLKNVIEAVLKDTEANKSRLYRMFLKIYTAGANESRLYRKFFKIYNVEIYKSKLYKTFLQIYTIEAVYFRAIVRHSDEDYLYKGIVQGYHFDKSGKIDIILISGAVQCKFSDSVKGEHKSRDIDQRYLLIKYSDMSTISFDYFVSELGKEEVTIYRGYDIPL